MPAGFWKLLLVDDDEDDYFLTRQMLIEARGGRFRLDWAPTLAAGWGKLNTDHYTAVLVDYDLGPENGLDFIREAVTEQYGAPLILYTGRGSFEVDMEAMEAGATLYLSKSEATPLLLERIIRYAIERKQTEEALRCARDELEQRVEERTRELAEVNAALVAEISEREEKERELRSTNELLEKVFSSIHIAIAYMDTEFNFIRVNDNYAKADEREPAFYVGKNHFDLFPYKENEAIFRRVVATGEDYYAYSRPFEYKEHPERGITYWDWSLQAVKEPDGKVIGVVLSLVNVSERVEAEIRLKENSKLLKGLFESTPDATLLVDSDGSIIRANWQTEALFGYRAETLLGERIEILIPERFREVHHQHWHEFIRDPVTRPMGTGLKLFGLHQSGEEFPADVMVSPLHLDGSIFTICVIRRKDII